MPAVRPTPLLLILLLALAGCASSASAPIGKKYPARPRNHPVPLMIQSDAPVWLVQKTGGEYYNSLSMQGLTLVGRVDVDGDFMGNWKALAAEARSEARELGGDLMILREYRAPYGASTNNAGRATEIAFKADVYRRTGPDEEEI